MNLFQYDQLSEMNEGEFAVYNYVSTHLNEIQQMNIRELSAATGVSTTTILRFCNKMGFTGYKDFKYQLSKSIQGQIKQKMYFPVAIHTIQFLQKAAEDQTLDAQLTQTAKWCLQSRQVLFSGFGTSGSLAEYGSRLLSSIGIESFSITDLFYPLPTRDQADTVLIILSVSGETTGMSAMADGFKKSIQRSSALRIQRNVRWQKCRILIFRIICHCPILGPSVTRQRRRHKSPLFIFWKP